MIGPDEPDGIAAWRKDLRDSAVALLGRRPAPAVALPQRAVRAFPLVGAAAGLAAALLHWLLVGLNMPPAAAAFAAVGLLAILSGARHEAGLAAYADRLAFRTEPSAAGRSGAPGILALVLSVLLRAAAVVALAGEGLAGVALVGAAAASRGYLPMAVMRLREGYAADPAVARGSRAAALIGGALAFALLAVWGAAAAGIIAVLVAAGAAVAVTFFAPRGENGYDSAVAGAAQQKAEIAFLVVAAMVAA